MTDVLAPVSRAATANGKIRVMIVDDAVVIRGLFARWVEAEQDLQVVASLRTGREAVAQVERANPDVVVLDIEMPELDGISALPQLLAKKRDLVVLMASTLTRRNAEISLRALSLGAADYIPKPPSTREVTASSNFRRELIEKIRGLGERAKRFRLPAAPAHHVPAAPIAHAPVAHETKPVAHVKAPSIVPDAAPHRTLRAFPPAIPRVLAIGCSTGGPQALTSLVTKMAPVFERAPVLITQHMPPTFTTILAEHLQRASGRPAHEAVHGEPVDLGKIYLAPGGKHMTVARHNGTAVIEINDGPLINFCKPAVDPMFTSAAAVWGHWLCGLVLTGMGSDGLKGSQAVVSAGGSIVTQDEASSVVWGMPGVVTNAGLSAAVLPLDQIAPRLSRLFAGDRA
ncbi:MAG: chemotaxis response regulator protein-glutamate methylesterase [Pseudolabrys sp.]|nr:chemotaxis response regulator protein-glutamate methylesterase [Pseudolabrys sp.]